MREQWYGDNRDLVKWSGVVRMARREGIKQIVYAPFLPGSDSVDEYIVPEVWDHFRSMNNLSQLGSRVGLHLDVVTVTFSSERRQAYLSAVIDRLQQPSTGRKLVLLDPDTGIAPKRATKRHVTLSDIKAIWTQLQLGDWLGLYQHARHHTGWLESTRQELEQAIGNSVTPVYKREVAHDAALLVSEKCEQTAQPTPAPDGWRRR